MTRRMPQLTTRTGAERDLLTTYRRLTARGQKALATWAELIGRLMLAPAPRRKGGRR
jgi:hypothetical protein